MTDILGELATVTSLTAADDGTAQIKSGSAKQPTVQFTMTMSPEGFAEFVEGFNPLSHEYGLFLYVTKRQDPKTHSCRYCRGRDFDARRQTYVCNEETSVCFECELDDDTTFYCSCFKEE